MFTFWSTSKFPCPNPPFPPERGILFWGPARVPGRPGKGGAPASPPTTTPLTTPGCSAYAAPELTEEARMKTINIIGCGKAGRTLARLWHEDGVFRIQDILNRSIQSAAEAAAFIGAGRAVAGYADLR